MGKELLSPLTNAEDIPCAEIIVQLALPLVNWREISIVSLCLVTYFSPPINDVQ